MIGGKIKKWILKKLRERPLVCVQWGNVKTTERNQMIFQCVIKKNQTQTLQVSVAQYISKACCCKYIYDRPAWPFLAVFFWCVFLCFFVVVVFFWFGGFLFWFRFLINFFYSLHSITWLRYFGVEGAGYPEVYFVNMYFVNSVKCQQVHNFKIFV